MKNNFKYNLTKILSAINNKIAVMTDDVVELHLNDDNLLYFKMGEITSCISSLKLQKVLDENNFINYNNRYEHSAIDILSIHFVNKLMTLQGKKDYSRINSSDFDMDNKKRPE